MTFKKIDLVITREHELGFIASDIMDVPYIPDGCGCVNYNTPCKLEADDFHTVKGYLIYLMPSGKYDVYNEHSLTLFDFDCIYDSTRLFDHATSGLRFHLSLLEMLKNKKKS
jgi:hypothetical protein